MTEHWAGRRKAIMKMLLRPLHMAGNLRNSCKQSGRKVLVAAGGVAANSFIRAELEKECRKHGYRLYMPPLKLCGDNGAMIGAQGYYEYLAGARADWSLNAYATRDIDDPIV